MFQIQTSAGRCYLGVELNAVRALQPRILVETRIHSKLSVRHMTQKSQKCQEG